MDGLANILSHQICKFVRALIAQMQMKFFSIKHVFDMVILYVNMLPFLCSNMLVLICKDSTCLFCSALIRCWGSAAILSNSIIINWRSWAHIDKATFSSSVLGKVTNGWAFASSPNSLSGNQKTCCTRPGLSVCSPITVHITNNSHAGKSCEHVHNAIFVSREESKDSPNSVPLHLLSLQ